jgi:tripartite ATP-independent transporter DctP family solute receptor
MHVGVACARWRLETRSVAITRLHIEGPTNRSKYFTGTIACAADICLVAAGKPLLVDNPDPLVGSFNKADAQLSERTALQSDENFGRIAMSPINIRAAGVVLSLATSLVVATSSTAQETRHFRFAHDQQLNSGYSVAYDIFSTKLKELSKGAMLVDQYPGAQLGQEPQILQLVKAGDLDFAIVSSANTATISPQAGVMSLHFLFRSEDHNVKSLGDVKVFEAIRDMIDGTVQGIHVIGIGTQGFRHLYGKKEIRKVEDLKGLKVRVQATATEDTMFPAYGAQTVHMPFGSVYTSLQTGVVDFAENAVNVYLINKHYEVAPVLSMSEHEANNAILWISDRLWQSLSADQKQWVLTAGRDVSTQEPKRGFELERQAGTKLKGMGVKIVTDVDKAGFQQIASPYLDKLAKDLGPHADKIKTLIRSIN